MIPKIIHYCWFGGNKLPDSVNKCIASWEKYCPDYQIVQWNEDNYDIGHSSYMREAYELKKYAFVSDYARLDIIFKRGGIYLDTDVELVKSLDEVLDNDCFMALEQPNRIATGLGFGAVKGSAFIKSNLDEYANEHFYLNGIKNDKICVDYTMTALKKSHKSVNQLLFGTSGLHDVTIYPPIYFCPYDLKTRKMNITKATIGIHHYDATWYSQNGFINSAQKWMVPAKMYTHQFVDQVFGKNSYDRLKQFLKRGG